jgi:uncharacterized protein (DUF433 family)
MVAQPDVHHPDSTEPPEYEPATEVDPVIRTYITVPPPQSAKNDPVVPGRSGHRYPVWAIFLNYRVAGQDVRRTLENYGDDLTAEHVAAVVRFAQRYPHLVLPYVDAALDDDYGRYAPAHR